MLFNSFPFLFIFLPAALALHWVVERYLPQRRLLLLVVLSFVFYGYWDWRFLPLLMISILFNWIIAEVFALYEYKLLISLAIIANLLVLGVFKYLNFFTSLLPISDLNGLHTDLILPLGISFFTFHHIMYLSDLRAGRAVRPDLVRYALYIAFFPQILSGPLVRWNEVRDQFTDCIQERIRCADRCARGIMLLIIGLIKKVILADPLSAYVNPVFQAAAEGKLPSVHDAWQATLGFTFQIYFDFSGYTDIALGVALFFGVVLPQNFDSPYRSISLQDFWRRWHMTLSRFLRDYLYIPLGGSRNGLIVQVWALFMTMALGGLWHGAGLTFVAWGVAHGVGLVVGVMWMRAGFHMPVLLGRAGTFLFVVMCWVLFRAQNFPSALLIYKGLLGFAPWGSAVEGLHVIAALALFVISSSGPTAWVAVQRIPANIFSGAVFAVLFVLVAFKMMSASEFQFIYFQF
ncbi:MAG TPA: MBOAT family O-acyltransferase [Afipia sp.]